MLLAPYNSSNGNCWLTWPSELNFTTVYYAVSVSETLFRFLCHRAAPHIAITGSGTTSVGIDKQSYNLTVAASNVGGDSREMISFASLVAARLHGGIGVENTHVDRYKTYISTSSRASFGSWNYSDEQY